MRGPSVAAASAVLAFIAASPSLAAATPYLTANASAGANSSCIGCAMAQDQTLNPATSLNSLSSSAASSFGSGSYADGMSVASFGSLRVYSDAFVPLADAMGDAQSKGYAEFFDLIPSSSIASGVLNLAFTVTGSHTLVGGLISVSALADLNFVVVDTSTNYALTFGNWTSTDSNQTTTITDNISVPTGDGVSLRVQFEADTYTYNTIPNISGPGYMDQAVVSDYHHTLNVNLTSPGATVVGLSGHDYSAVPEPATWSLMLLGLGGLAAVTRRKPRAAIA